MSPRYIDASSIVPMLSLSERQKAWARIIQFVFTDTLLSALNDQHILLFSHYRNNATYESRNKSHFYAICCYIIGRT